MIALQIKCLSKRNWFLPFANKSKYHTWLYDCDPQVNYPQVITIPVEIFEKSVVNAIAEARKYNPKWWEITAYNTADKRWYLVATSCKTKYMETA